MLCIAYDSTTNVVRSAVCRVITVKIFSLFATRHVHDRPQTIDQSVQETVKTHTRTYTHMRAFGLVRRLC